MGNEAPVLSWEEQKQGRLDRIDAEINSLACSHPKTYLRRRTATNGAKMYALQCMRCGERVGDWIPHTKVKTTDPIEAWDDGLRQRYRESTFELTRALRDRRNAVAREEFFRDYDDYLRSPEWAQRRGRVLDRCGGVCEGCGVRLAVHVHHKTYQHYRREFLFELVGVCKECHEAIHEKELQEVAHERTS